MTISGMRSRVPLSSLEATNQGSYYTSAHLHARSLALASHYSIPPPGTLSLLLCLQPRITQPSHPHPPSPHASPSRLSPSHRAPPTLPLSPPHSQLLTDPQPLPSHSAPRRTTVQQRHCIFLTLTSGSTSNSRVKCSSPTGTTWVPSSQRGSRSSLNRPRRSTP